MMHISLLALESSVLHCGFRMDEWVDENLEVFVVGPT